MSEQTKKQPYVQPVLRRVELKADEVLVSGCKTAAGGNSSTDPGCATGNCTDVGS